MRAVYDDDEQTRMDSLEELALGGDTNLEAAAAAAAAGYSDPTPSGHGQVMQGGPPQRPPGPPGPQGYGPPVAPQQHGHAAPNGMRTPPNGYPAQPMGAPHPGQPMGAPHPGQPMGPPPYPGAPHPGPPYPYTPPGGMPVASPFPGVERPSGQFPTPPPSGRYPTPPSGVYQTPAPSSGMYPTPVPSPSGMYPAAVDHGTQTKLASLAALSLDKGGNTGSYAPAPRSGGGSKLPWVLLAIAVVGGGYYVYSTGNKQAAPIAQPDTSGSASKVTASRSGFTAAGYLAAREPIVLSATTAGRLDRVTVKSGDRVKKGQLVAALADGQLRAELGRERAKVRDAQRALERTRKLVNAQAATRLDLDKAQGQVEIASADARVAEQRLKELQIYSPIDATVLEVLVRPGETITGQGAPVLRVADVSSLAAEVNIGENDYKQIYLGQECDVVSDSQRDKTYRGVVREIAQQADRARGTTLVKVDVEATPDSALRPNMAIQVRFKPREEAPAGPAPGGSGGSAAEPARPAKPTK